MGLNHSMQLVMSGVLNVTQLIGVVTSLWTMDRYGRRPLLLWGSIFMTIAQMIIAILVAKFSHSWPSHRDAGWISVAFLLFYMLSFGATWGPVPWAAPSEIFPSSLRAKGVALSTCSNWFNNFIIGLVWLLKDAVEVLAFTWQKLINHSRSHRHQSKTPGTALSRFLRYFAFFR